MSILETHGFMLSILEMDGFILSEKSFNLLPNSDEDMVLAELEEQGIIRLLSF